MSNNENEDNSTTKDPLPSTSFNNLDQNSMDNNENSFNENLDSEHDEDHDNGDNNFDDDDDDDDDEEDDEDNDCDEEDDDDDDGDDEDEDDDLEQVDYSFVDEMLENIDVDALKQKDEQPEQQQQQQQLQQKQQGQKRQSHQPAPYKKRKHHHKNKTETKQKNILIKRGQDLFEFLPEGWVEITHFSGIPIYLEKKSRVCTTSKPYNIGTGSARKHQIPLSAIPCLQYRIELDKERERELELQQKQQQQPEQTDNPELITPIAKVETLEENKKEKLLDYNKVRDYCKRLFEFKVVNIKKFTNWAERRKHEQSKKLAQRPSLPESTKLITCTIPRTNSANNSGGRTYRKEFVMNPAGKSDVCILHEYVQHTKRTQPKYRFKELENVSKPYCATVYIGDVEYGNGFGSSKKEAKTEAARASLSILIPQLNNSDEKEEKKPPSLNDLSFFDNIGIEDQRVSDLCLKAGQYSPYQILVECKKRSHGIKDLEIKTDVRLIKHQRIEFKMTVGEYQAIVICKNKREGKQRAAQKILKCLYPDVKSWGAMLKLYGQGSCKTSKEKKEEAQKITELQNNACSNRPNYDILNKLKEEMLKLREKTSSYPPASETVLTSLNRNL